VHRNPDLAAPMMGAAQHLREVQLDAATDHGQ